ncbi:hypothetical protein SLA2020_421800 [Shorea laevis]
MADSFDQDALRPLTKEEFYAFHNIDRIMFFRLVFNLQRDPGESMKVMAFLLWLEQTKQACNLVYHTLPWPNSLVNALANEVVLCLQCIESVEFPSALNSVHVPLIHKMTKGGVSLRLFHDDRLCIIHGIEKNVNEVCLRAFEDMMEQVKQSKAKSSVEDIGGQGMNPLFQEVPPVVPGVVNYETTVLGTVQQEPRLVTAGVDSKSVELDVYDLGVQRKVMNGEVGEDMSRLHISNTPGEKEKREVEVPAEERTIFLTFSKGYPISEKEIRDFFTRKFGDCIEAIHMQEVPAEKQPLYARLVVQPPSSLEKILGGWNKTKFSINGKHLRGRKYKPEKAKSTGPSMSRSASSTAS